MLHVSATAVAETGRIYDLVLLPTITGDRTVLAHVVTINGARTLLSLTLTLL